MNSCRACFLVSASIGFKDLKYLEVVPGSNGVPGLSAPPGWYDPEIYYRKRSECYFFDKSLK